MTTKAKLLEKFGSEEKISEYYRELQAKSRLHPNNQKGNHKGGFSDKKFAKQASKLGVEARVKKQQAITGEDESKI